jgi:hypothetical protein
MGHRAEGILRTALWADEDPTSPWRAFNGQEADYKNLPEKCPDEKPVFEGGPGLRHCGNTHYPPNARCGYDTENKDTVTSDCPDWTSYPDLAGTTKTVNCNDWGCNEEGWQRYWFEHLPRALGEIDTTMVVSKNDWWTYLVGRPWDAARAASSEFEDGWRYNLLDGFHGRCNFGEWMPNTAGSAWVEFEITGGLEAVSLYDRACLGEQTGGGTIELSTGQMIPFGELENSGREATVVQIGNPPGLEWIRIHVDPNTAVGTRPGLSEVVLHETEPCQSASCIPALPAWTVESEVLCADGSDPTKPKATSFFTAFWPPNPLKWRQTIPAADPQNGVFVIPSVMPFTSFYVGLEAVDGEVLIYRGEPPHSKMTAAEYFNPLTPMVKWDALDIPKGNYKMTFEAPASWCP